MRRLLRGWLALLTLFLAPLICGGVRVPINSLCVFSSKAPSPFRWLDWPGEYHLAFFRIHNLHSAQRGNENE
jgi:hypothetical protein